MKRSGIIHPQLLQAIAKLGHTDKFAIADSGLPIPPQVERIDLGFVLGKPEFQEVLEAVLPEVVVESALIASEAEGKEAGKILARYFPDSHSCAHEDFKRALTEVRFVIRTGSTLPYANVIISSGVPF